MNQLIARAAAHGIRVVLYLQPPRAVYCEDTAFWNAHADIGGEVVEITDGRGATSPMRSLCTSHPAVRKYLREAFADLVRALPGLGAVLIISASEYPAHCYSRRNCRPNENRPFDMSQEQVPVHCPACSRRKPENVILDLLHDIRDGIRRSSAELPILFWNWCWSMYLVPAEETIIRNMPQDTVLVCDFERGGVMTTPEGKQRRIQEYSLMYPGPSEAFLRALELAHERGIPVMPKLQIGTTHEGIPRMLEFRLLPFPEPEAVSLFPAE